MEEELYARDIALQLLKDSIPKAKERMKKSAENHRSEREFQVGDCVFLRLQPSRQLTVSNQRTTKLSLKFYGPYEIIQKIGSVAYKLNLPLSANIYPVFRVSQLKQKLRTNIIVQEDLPTSSMEIIAEPERILALNHLKAQ